MLRSFGQITWRAVGAANQARKKTRTLGEFSGGTEAHQEPACRVDRSPKGIEAERTNKTITETRVAALTAPGTAGSVDPRAIRRDEKDGPATPGGMGRVARPARPATNERFLK